MHLWSQAKLSFQRAEGPTQILGSTAIQNGDQSKSPTDKKKEINTPSTRIKFPILFTLFFPLTLQVTTPAAQSVIRRSRRAKMKGLFFQELQSNVTQLYLLCNLPTAIERSFTQSELYSPGRLQTSVTELFFLADHLKKPKLRILATEAQLWYLLHSYHLKCEWLCQANTCTQFS